MRHIGELEMHLVFMTIGNIQSDVRMQTTSYAWYCVAFLPIPWVWGPSLFPDIVNISTLSPMLGCSFCLSQGNCTDWCCNDRLPWIHLKLFHPPSCIHCGFTRAAAGCLHCKECLSCDHGHSTWIWWQIPTSILVRHNHSPTDCRCMCWHSSVGHCYVPTKSEGNKITWCSPPVLVQLEVCQPNVLPDWQDPPFWP